jgi:hypothetical protein
MKNDPLAHVVSRTLHSTIPQVCGYKLPKILELFPWGDAINRISKTDTFLK